MAMIEVQRIITEVIRIPNCFCGGEPEINWERAQGDDIYKRVLTIECPYCGAHAPISKTYNAESINSKYYATSEVAQAWKDLIDRKVEK